MWPPWGWPSGGCRVSPFVAATAAVRPRDSGAALARSDGGGVARSVHASTTHLRPRAALPFSPIQAPPQGHRPARRPSKDLSLPYHSGAVPYSTPPRGAAGRRPWKAGGLEGGAGPGRAMDSANIDQPRGARRVATLTSTAKRPLPRTYCESGWIQPISYASTRQYCIDLEGMALAMAQLTLLV